MFRYATLLDDDPPQGLSSAYVPRSGAEDFGTLIEGPSLTRQEFADECDINVIMARYEKTGVISHVNQRQPMYLDVSEPIDLQRALEIVQTATDAFMSLPAKVRAEFENDPVAFVAYAEDPANLDRMREWGLAPPAAEEPEVNPAPAPAPQP